MAKEDFIKQIVKKKIEHTKPDYYIKIINGDGTFNFQLIQWLLIDYIKGTFKPTRSETVKYAERIKSNEGRELTFYQAETELFQTRNAEMAKCEEHALNLLSSEISHEMDQAFRNLVKKIAERTLKEMEVSSSLLKEFKQVGKKTRELERLRYGIQDVGRPKKPIDEQTILDAMSQIPNSRNVTCQNVAKTLGLGKEQLRKRVERSELNWKYLKKLDRYRRKNGQN